VGLKFGIPEVPASPDPAAAVSAFFVQAPNNSAIKTGISKTDTIL
jgi:hypothetical protein